MAWFKASTREVCPVPLAHNCLFFAKTIVLDLVCLHNLEANIKSSISCAVGAVLVAVFKSDFASVIKSLS